MVDKENFSLKMTGVDASAQNGITESSNKTLENMKCCILHVVDFGPKYWSYALIHAVYIKNRLLHSSIKTTPFKASTGQQPNITNLRNFVSRIYVKKPRKRDVKLDNHTSNGIFLGYTATTKNVYYKDKESSNAKMGTHVIFDEAHFAVPASKILIAAQILQQLGYANFNNEYKDGKFISGGTLKVKLLSKTVIAPAQSTPDSIGRDIYYSGPPITIIYNTLQPLATDVIIQPPQCTYISIAPRSGLVHNHNIHVLANVFNAVFRGPLKVLLQNLGEEEVNITTG